MPYLNLSIPDADWVRVRTALCKSGGFDTVTDDNVSAVLQNWVFSTVNGMEYSNAEAAKTDALLKLQKAASTDGQAWRQPTGAHDAYPLGRTVLFGGKVMENILDNNVWSPALGGWREKGVPVKNGTGETYPGIVAWVQPLGAQDAYQVGARVTHKGGTYTSTAANNVWEPGVYGWTKDA